jgi:hypothetical protein
LFEECFVQGYILGATDRDSRSLMNLARLDVQNSLRAIARTSARVLYHER